MLIWHRTVQGYTKLKFSGKIQAFLLLEDGISESLQKSLC